MCYCQYVISVCAYWDGRGRRERMGGWMGMGGVFGKVTTGYRLRGERGEHLGTPRIALTVQYNAYNTYIQCSNAMQCNGMKNSLNPQSLKPSISRSLNCTSIPPRPYFFMAYKHQTALRIRTTGKKRVKQQAPRPATAMTRRPDDGRPVGAGTGQDRTD